MSLYTPLWGITEQVVGIFPQYHPDAADINEALDHGVASCAVRAYAAGLLARHAFPNISLYPIDYGWDPAHGGDFHGENGVYSRMGHAITKVWAPEGPLIIDSDHGGAMDVDEPVDSHMGYVYYDLNAGYRRYLDLVDMDDIEVDPDEILDHLLKRIKSGSAAEEIRE